MKKLALLSVVLIALSFVSCEKTEVSDEVQQIEESYATGQGEVGDPVEDEDEEGS